MKIGFLVNPISGLGGSVGFKGTDGFDTARRALENGAVPQASSRALLVLKYLYPFREHFTLYTVPGSMGENIASEAGFHAEILQSVCQNARNSFLATNAADTITGAAALEKCGVELLIFAGGDGTARNVMDAIGMRIPVIGIPAGVKMHSGVFAVNPRNAAQLAQEYITGKTKETETCEIMDIDETAFRNGFVSASLYGYMRIPVNHLRTQGGKISGVTDLVSAVGIARDISTEMMPDCLYIIGSGSTTAAIMQELKLPNTLLGIDLVKNKQLMASDAGEKEILQALDKVPQAKIIVTPIGGQACLFGRGNQQLSPRVLRKVGKENIIIVATKSKLKSFYGNCLLVDTGDEATDKWLSGYYRVVVANRERTIFRLGADRV